ncbi:MAG: HpaII family restriction endonuclease [Vampirovibrionales bacterium]
MVQLSLMSSALSHKQNHSLADQHYPFTFIDLFAGIGGFHQALHSLGGQCVFASEKDPFARQTYLANHSIDPDWFNEDIRTLSPHAIPNHEILCAGFPCQPFSQAGLKKGFSDGDSSERGNLFFCILDILEAKRPIAFILENVRHLIQHDGGHTLSTILHHLNALDYEVSYKVLKASEFGIPQHRPRVFIVGFDKRQIATHTKFTFPSPVPLTQTMSDIWEEECHKEIGFTLRVGGKGSGLEDRRNWDTYLVNGKVKRLGIPQAKKMMGLPETFHFPVSHTQAMKQLGNSVCVPVVKHVAQQVLGYIERNHRKGDTVGTTFNKGEWSELIPFISLLLNPILNFGNINGENLNNEHVVVYEIANPNSPFKYQLKDAIIKVINLEGFVYYEAPISSIVSPDMLDALLESIRHAKGTFEISHLKPFMEKLNLQKFKSNNLLKSDLTLSFKTDQDHYPYQGLGIKSYLGGLPTLLNASSATNFVFEVQNFKGVLDDINKINTTHKIKDRLTALKNQGAILNFIGCENTIHHENLRKVDSDMPKILSKILLDYYHGKATYFRDFQMSSQEICRLKDYLKAVLLGLFANKAWDGHYSANGCLLVKKSGSLVLYHVIKDAILKEYLWQHTKLDTPSSTRHRFGTLYQEDSGKYFIKLNLQIRMTP